MNSDQLTILVGVAGFVASIPVSIVFYAKGKSSASAEKQDLLKEIHELEDLLTNAFNDMTQHLPSKHDLRRMLDEPPTPKGDSVEHHKAAPDDPALKQLVRASLGSLVDARGEVSLPRLLRDVGHKVGPARLPEVATTLVALRDAGEITWEGDAADPSRTQVIRVGNAAHEGKS